MQPSSKTVIVIAGPTAVGKTAVAIEVAKQFNAEIISADSRQCYKELNIGVARPSPEELTAVPHHFVASHSIHEKLTAASFEDYALQKAAELFKRDDTIVMVGGTGLYIKAFAEGMDPIPQVPQTIHDEVISAYSEKGMEWLQAEIKTHDPLYWEKGEIQNPQRMTRALEVMKATGVSVLSFRKGEKKQRPFNVVKIAVQLPKEVLHHNINIRVDKMMEAGLLDEVKSLQEFQALNALQTVGYKELFAFLKDEISLSHAVESIKQNTRQYAKRQMTWFRKDKEYTWCEPDAGHVNRLLRERGF